MGKKMKLEEKMFLSVAELMELLGLSRSVTYRLVNQDEFPKVRVGDRIIIPTDQFKEWVRMENERGK